MIKIRIYGMTYFDENGEYWGNTSKPLIDANCRLNARSVKIFADGMLCIGVTRVMLTCWMVGALRSGGAAVFHSEVLMRTFDSSIPSFMSPTQIILKQVAWWDWNLTSWTLSFLDSCEMGGKWLAKSYLFLRTSNSHDLIECSCHRRSGKRNRFGCIWSCSSRDWCDCTEASTWTRTNHDESGHGAFGKT